MKSKMSAVADALSWDLRPFFPGLDSPEFEQAIADFERGIGAFERSIESLEALPAGSVEGFGEALDAYNALAEDLRLLLSFVHGLVTTDSRNDDAQRARSRLERLDTRSMKSLTRLTAWIGARDLATLVASSDVARDHAFALDRLSERSRRLMVPGEEELAADLSLSGSNAWGNLYRAYTSQIETRIELPAGADVVTMSEIRTMAYDADQRVRRIAYETELDAWREHSLTLAACLNGVTGSTDTLARRRGWESPLDDALFRANADRPTLDALMAAAEESFPIFRRYLRAKAKALGHPDGLPWYDLFAPMGRHRAWTYEGACAFVVEHFESYSPRLGDFARRAFGERWVDVSPKPGKVDGAYCMPVRGDESRILMNFKPAFGSVSTLAHELGHGYHNVCLAKRTALQRNTPMTLAETASIFCETLIRRAATRDGAEEERLAILEASISGACQTVVDICSRFFFERSVYATRAERELSAAELCETMRAAQERAYGDGLHAEFRHPYMWAAKPHYYSRGYYNFPYMYGMLFGLGLYAQYEQDPDGFRDRYDDLLSSTGLADGAELGRRFGIDVQDVGFWRSSLAVVAADVDRYVEAVERGA